jgi:uncharacterized protein YjbI with pentapeptide repeats
MWSPFGLFEGRLDLRGLRMPPPVRIVAVPLKGVDLGSAELTPPWMEHCLLEDVRFNAASLDGLSDQGNRFERCRFVGTSLVGAHLGYQGSQYYGCTFERCNFHKGGGIRAEFYGCRFADCRLKGMDFQASVFEDCVFEGLLEDVWFRGAYEYPEDERKYGTPKKNRMTNVSFAKARLDLCDFTNDCDHSTVTMPESGEYRRYDRWSKRLVRLQVQAERWDEPARSEGQLFVKVQMPHARTQEWMILGLAELQAHIAPYAAREIVRSLDEPV